MDDEVFRLQEKNPSIIKNGFIKDGISSEVF